ncbi:MAG: carboxylate-amine ligase [Phreatobacter sp.]|uniref:carboxylate-amine ligase n=1 Tax=Phreatobacter sp. TaxID=1966341 RepID=UPI004036A759
MPSLSSRDDQFSYRFGIEEEYFVVDRRTGGVRAQMSADFLNVLTRTFGSHVMTELLQCQLEVATSPTGSPASARQQLLDFRQGITQAGKAFDAGIIAAGTHPSAKSAQMHRTRKRRYDKVISDLRMIGTNNVLSGLHVHVELPDPERRVQVMYRMIPYLHLFIALSASSPFWEGQDSGLASYRTVGNKMLPRSGLPELFKTLDEYSSYVGALVDSRVIPDASYIWWGLRPSLQHPTLELRVMDSCTSVEDAVALASLYRCLVRHLCRDDRIHEGLTALDRAIADENTWRAARYGTGATFIDRQSPALPFRQELARVLELVDEDADALGLGDELARIRTIPQRGTSAHRQVNIAKATLETGRTSSFAMREVVRWLRVSTESGTLVTSETPPTDHGPGRPETLPTQPEAAET